MYIVQCIDYIGYSTRTLCAVCEECSVFAIHYKYIVEGLRKTIRRTKIIDLSSSEIQKIFYACILNKM